MSVRGAVSWASEPLGEQGSGGVSGLVTIFGSLRRFLFCHGQTLLTIVSGIALFFPKPFLDQV